MEQYSLHVEKWVLATYDADREFPTYLTLKQALIEIMVTLLRPFKQLTREMSSSTATTTDRINSVEMLECLLKKKAQSDHRVKTAC